MILFVLRRIATSIPTLLALMTLTFFVMKIVPGGPFDQEKALPAEIKANLDAKYHFDEPVWKQYTRYLGDLARGDFGPSYRYMGGRTVNDIIAEALPVSAELGAAAILVAIVLGVPIGVLSAHRRNSWFDFTAMFWAMAGMSLPNFLVASIFVMIFSVRLGWLPPALWEDWRSAVLPVMTLAVRPLALIARLTRASVIETLTTDYVRTAEAKGLDTSTVLFKHALKNALVPVVTLTGPLVAAVITGSFVVEFFFAIPGLGKHFVSAVTDRDYPLIMGVTVVYGVIVVACNLAVDLAYAWIDPRMRVE
ncbi:MAG: ABC transporter permease [Deltaproteobacteria bacterium]|nr:ABC transporter permease [Deltaproteobacteria bacterium]